MNWNETLIRASSVGYIMTEPVTKADKEAGLLSKTAQRHLLDVYISNKYNRSKDIQTKQMKKGIEVEQESIDLLSMFLKKPFAKNTERFSNKYITGLPDIIDDGIIDIKSINVNFLNEAIIKKETAWNKLKGVSTSQTVKENFKEDLEKALLNNQQIEKVIKNINIKTF